MINKHKLYSITLVSAAIISMLINIAGTAPFAHITNSLCNNVSIIDTATNKIVTNVSVGINPYGVAVTSDGTKVYVTDDCSNNVSVINITTYSITNVSVGYGPIGVAITPDGSRVYIANDGYNNVSVINTAINTLTTNVTVGSEPVAPRLFIRPANPALNITKSARTNNPVNPTTY